jgi:hypothetical protein
MSLWYAINVGYGGDMKEASEKRSPVECGVINVYMEGGIMMPEKCLRGLKTCEPYNQIASEGCATFICCGENDGTDRQVKQDKYTLCFKSETTDERTHNDKRDLIHQASVIMGALAIIENKDSEACQREFPLA